MMMKALMIRAVCALVLAIRLIGSVVMPDSCDSWDFSKRKATLKDHVETINYYIRENVSHFGSQLTADELKVSLATFQNLQAKLSGKLMCEIDEVKYYYPRFVLERNDQGYTVTEETKYYIHPLNGDENGVYKGVAVSIFYNEEMEAETEENVNAFNAKLASLGGSYITSAQIGEYKKRVDAFNQEYNNKLLGFCKKHNHPLYAPVVEVSVFTEAGYKGVIGSGAPIPEAVDPLSALWEVHVGAEDPHGCRHIMIFRTMYLEPQDAISTAEMIRQSKQAENGTPDGTTEIAAGSYMIPDVPVEIK